MLEQIQKKCSDFLDLPRDIFLDLPRVTVLGNVQAVIENHRGIIEYSPGIIRLSSNKGEIVIKGSELLLESILPEEITVMGKIDKITFPG